jgi:ribosomal protein S27E
MRIMPQVAARMASRDENTGRYQRHRPEQTLLYRIVEEYYPAFAGHLAEQGRELPDYVHREFEDYLKCGRLEHGFLRVRCESCHAEHLVAFSCKRRGICPSCGAWRMAEFVQWKGGLYFLYFTAMPGTIIDVLVSIDDKANAGDALLITEAMKMETEIQTPIAGTIKDIHVQKGDSVTPNEILIEIAE